MTYLCTVEMKEAERMPAMLTFLMDYMDADHVYVYRLRFFEEKEWILERHDLCGPPNVRKNHLQMMGTSGVYMCLEDNPAKACNALFLDDFPLWETLEAAFEDAPEEETENEI